MQIKYGLISADSHVVLDRDAYTRRMSAIRWGDRIPQVVETEHRGKTVSAWRVDGKLFGVGRGVTNCPAAMDDPSAHRYPQLWEEVPRRAFDPFERLEALDSDGVDAEVLFANDPARSAFYQFEDPEFEFACVQAYNDALAEWRQVSDRYVPLGVIPYLGDIAETVAEVERIAQLGHRGIEIQAEPSLAVKGLPHLNDPYWYPLWDVCQSHDLPIHLHESGGLAGTMNFPRWDGYTSPAAHTTMTVPTCSFPAQFFPNLIFSGTADRFPRLKWVSAETGLGWVPYVLEGCDYEWERRHLWTEGLLTRPSEVFQRQVYVNFFFEVANVPLRHWIGIDNIMWESDYPHTASNFPHSRDYVERALAGVPEGERKKVLYENAMRVYKLG
jgi:predicted TIM-barrel fold metal-dependent hydrolase